MPAYGNYSNTTPGWKASDGARVFINKVEQPNITCLTVEENTGVAPSRAVLRIGGNTLTLTGPVTLNRYKWPWKPGSSVEVLLGYGNVMFRGILVRRIDDGGEDCIMWEAIDDRWLMMQIPVRGAVVLDPYDQTPKFIARYVPRMNPGGNWNMTWGPVKGALCPMFTATADVGKVYQSPDEVFTDTPVLGQLSAFTPRRALQYYNMVASLQAGDLPGCNAPHWRSMAVSTRLKWPVSSTNISGKDTATGNDPLDKKMPDTSFRGQRLLGAVVHCLDVAGTHGLCLEYGTDQSTVKFYARGITAQASGSPSTDMTINLIRGGNADSLDTAYDFSLSEDATETAESSLAEGDVVRVESNFVQSTLNPEIAPAWTQAEQDCFLRIIEGVDSGGTYYANMPGKEGSTSNDMICDGGTGTGGLQRPFAFRYSPAAIQLARQSFPHVFKAFKINSVQISGTNKVRGVSNEYVDQSKFPVLGIPRPIVAEQLQYYVKDNIRLLGHYPVRIQIKNGGQYKDVVFNNGLRVDDNGWIWLDGLAEDMNGTDDCVYSGSLTSAPLAVTLKDFRMNAAIPLDHRVLGYAEIESGQSVFDELIRTELGGLPMVYVDSPEAYHESHQIDSLPAGYQSYIADDSGAAAYLNSTSNGLTRYLPPGSEAIHAQYAAKRKLFGARWIKRRSRWSMVGIRPDYRVGQWISKVKVIQPNAGDSDYDIDAPIENIVHDFVNQSTIIGGLLSQVSNNAPAKNAPAAPTKAAVATEAPKGETRGAAKQRRTAAVAALDASGPQDE